MKNKVHPYHYSEDKNITQRLIDFGVPLILFWLYFQFYNFGKVSPQEMVKTTGLMSVALLSLTLLIGPACRFFPTLDVLKAHRKFWGILSFFVALSHAILIYIFYVNYNLAKLFNPASPKYLGLLAGLASLLILSAVTLTSNKLALNSLSPKIWKIVQSTAYLALILAVLHFYLVESVNGVLVIKRVVGQITFGFAAFVVIVRIVTMILPTLLKSNLIEAKKS
ncbi:ferric reductase-like transmembrane domain-containing protein [Candidatus Daviesbacteria bacterium]|nr:ferric reductase-like transmembrane domain-containing protein [Candidatus Daviesbacteria bacterium]